MKTEHIIENLLDWKHTWKPTGQLRLTIEAAIGELQFAENKLRLVVARQNELMQQLLKERDQAREEAETVRDRFDHKEISIFTWENGSK